MITNCPNCGAVLNNGKCAYCGTNVKLGNTIDVLENGTCELTLQIRKGNNIYVFPLVGHICSVTRQFDTAEISTCDERYDCSIACAQRVSFDFEGYLKGE